MKTPQIPAMPGMSPLGFREPRQASNEKTVAERQWQAGKLAPVAQKPCDHGLFSDDAKQIDLIAKLRSA